MQKAAVIVAGGSGKRMGTELPKQFLSLAGKPILVHTVERFLNFDPTLHLVLVLPEEHLERWAEISLTFFADASYVHRLETCKGGPSRTESVFNGLLSVRNRLEKDEECLVAIHDGVRPFIQEEILKNAYDLAETKGASVVCVPVKSSMRERLESGKSQAVDRSRFFHVQTPQIFQLSNIVKAFEKRPHNLFTDDASLYDNYGGHVAICEGSYDNIKITTPEDIEMGESILRRS